MTTIINGSSPSITFSDGSAQTSATRPFLNRIINGAMVIDQRNAGASVTPTGGAYTIDRWYSDPSGGFAWYSFQRNAGSVTPPVGFTNYLGITSTGANTPSASQFSSLFQRIEGFNIADLGWGTANAKTVTLSFWVRSSLTGTFGGAINNGDSNRSYPYTFLISSANTWEYKTVTIAGDTTGTWNTNNTTGMTVNFNLGSGSNYQGTPNTWSGSWFKSATGAVNISATNGATFYITGVQLEVGSTATSFDYRPYGTELALCQRYYWRNTALNNNAGLGGQGAFGSTNTIASVWMFPVAMRASPTATQSGTSLANGATAATTSSLTTSFYSNQSATVQFVGSSSPFVAAQGGYIYAQTAGGYVDFSAEL